MLSSPEPLVRPVALQLVFVGHLFSYEVKLEADLPRWDPRGQWDLRNRRRWSKSQSSNNMKVIRSAGRPSVGGLYIYRVLHQIHPNTSQIKQVYASVLFLSVSRGAQTPHWSSPASRSLGSPAWAAHIADWSWCQGQMLPWIADLWKYPLII